MTKIYKYMLGTRKYVKNCVNLCLEFANNVLLITSFEVILRVWTVFGTSPRKLVTWSQIRRMSRPQRTNNYSGPESVT